MKSCGLERREFWGIDNEVTVMTRAEMAFYLFSIFNILRVFSYLPQIYRIAQDQAGATAISYSTWGLWTAANASTGIYALVAVADLPLAAISLLNSICCAVVICLTAFKRRGLRQNRQLPTSTVLFTAYHPSPGRVDSMKSGDPVRF